MLHLLAGVAVDGTSAHGEKHEERMPMAENDGRNVTNGGSRDAKLDEGAAAAVADGSQSTHSRHKAIISFSWQM